MDFKDTFRDEIDNIVSELTNLIESAPIEFVTTPHNSNIGLLEQRKFFQEFKVLKERILFLKRMV